MTRETIVSIYYDEYIVWCVNHGVAALSLDEFDNAFVFMSPFLDIHEYGMSVRVKKLLDAWIADEL